MKDSGEAISQSSELIMPYAIEYGIPLLKSMVILIIGLWMIKAIGGPLNYWKTP